MPSSTKPTAPIISAAKNSRTRTLIFADIYESQIILYGGARRMLELAGINLKGLNVNKLKAELQELTKQKNELTSTYKNCEKEVRDLTRKQENLNQYLG